jgi:hypothetical protein
LECNQNFRDGKLVSLQNSPPITRIYTNKSNGLRVAGKKLQHQVTGLIRCLNGARVLEKPIHRTLARHPNIFSKN